MPVVKTSRVRSKAFMFFAFLAFGGAPVAILVVTSVMFAVSLEGERC